MCRRCRLVASRCLLLRLKRTPSSSRTFTESYGRTNSKVRRVNKKNFRIFSSILFLVVLIINSNFTSCTEGGVSASHCKTIQCYADFYNPKWTYRNRNFIVVRCDIKQKGAMKRIRKLRYFRSFHFFFSFTPFYLFRRIGEVTSIYLKINMHSTKLKFRSWHSPWVQMFKHQISLRLIWSRITFKPN